MATATSKRYLCPECGGGMVKAGVVPTNRTGTKKKQQWLCRNCRRRTLNPIKKGVSTQQ